MDKKRDSVYTTLACTCHIEDLPKKYLITKDIENKKYEMVFVCEKCNKLRKMPLKTNG